jgi:hypothetical protein
MKETDNIGICFYKNIKKELEIQKIIIKRELLRSNITQIPELRKLTGDIISQWISNSFVENIN